MIVYSNFYSSRLAYVLQFLSHYFNTTFEWTDAKEKFLEENTFRINYSDAVLSDKEVWIKPMGLLEKRSMETIDVPVAVHNGNKILFPNESVTGFDLFSAIFYLLSRYEEYLPHVKDEYGRYAHINSVAFKEGFLRQPLINIWLDKFRKLLAEKTGFALAKKSFQFLPTYDIDIAWSYRNKGFLRNTGGALKEIASADFRGLNERMQVLRGKEQDPYDCYEGLDKLHQQYGLEPIYFFHVGSKRNEYDKSISINNAQFQSLVKTTADKYKIGLHPSWHSGNEAGHLTIEKKSLENISSKTIYRSRQHYIRFSLPNTFQQLIKEGITEDYSIGYGSINGFRASVASPFYWYDLQKEAATSLLLYPFCFMDANAYFEENISAEQAHGELTHYYHAVKNVGGLLCTLWHNTFLGTDKKFTGWKEIYERFLHEMYLPE